MTRAGGNAFIDPAGLLPPSLLLRSDLQEGAIIGDWNLIPLLDAQPTGIRIRGTQLGDQRLYIALKAPKEGEFLRNAFLEHPPIGEEGGVTRFYS